MPYVERDVATGRVPGVNAQQVRVLARRGLPRPVLAQPCRVAAPGQREMTHQWRPDDYRNRIH